MSVLEPMLLELNTNGHGIDHNKAALQNRWENLNIISMTTSPKVLHHTNQATILATYHHG